MRRSRQFARAHWSFKARIIMRLTYTHKLYLISVVLMNITIVREHTHSRCAMPKCFVATTTHDDAEQNGGLYQSHSTLVQTHRRNVCLPACAGRSVGRSVLSQLYEPVRQYTHTHTSAIVFVNSPSSPRALRWPPRTGVNNTLCARTHTPRRTPSAFSITMPFAAVGRRRRRSYRTRRVPPHTSHTHHLRSGGTF